jgi:hypothetical protein
MQDLNDKVTGNSLTAAEWNQVPSEIQNVIEDTGQTLAGGDLNQLGKGIAQYAGNGDFYTDSGAADAYVLSVIGSKQASTAYVDGMRVRFIPGNANTGASTVNVAGLGVKDIRDEADTALTGGELTTGAEVILSYSVATGRFKLIRSALSGAVTVSVETVSGAYTPPPGVKALEFIAIGGGGGSGGVDGQGAGTAAASLPGGGAGTSIDFTTSIEASYTLTIGAAGAAGASGNNAGGVGGNTTVASTGVNLTANGGPGGAGDFGSSGNSAPNGTDGGAASGGAINIPGGGTGSSSVVGGFSAGSSKGGDSLFGTGGRGSTNSAGVAGSGFGSGGGGSGNVGTATNFSGAAGAPGAVIVKEHF